MSPSSDVSAHRPFGSDGKEPDPESEAGKAPAAEAASAPTEADKAPAAEAASAPKEKEQKDEQEGNKKPNRRGGWRN